MSARFQSLMEWIAHLAGGWQHFAIWILLLVLWIAIGPVMHFSDTWQLLANTPTTWYELFLGLALLVDGAVQINLIIDQHAKLAAMVEHLARMDARIEARLGIEDTEKLTD